MIHYSVQALESFVYTISCDIIGVDKPEQSNVEAKLFLCFIKWTGSQGP